MADSEDRRRILDMLAAGSISVDEASNLLKALGGGQSSAPAALPAARRSGGPARLLRISIDEPGSADGKVGTKVRVNVPLSLARFATRFLPAEASIELNQQGIDISEIIASLGDELPDGKLVDIEAASETDPGKVTNVVIEVV